MTAFSCSRLLHVLKWDLFFNERGGLTTTGHCLLLGVTQVHTHSLTDPNLDKHSDSLTSLVQWSSKLLLALASIQGLTIKFVNLPPCACRDSSGQKSQYGLMTLAYQHFTAVLLLLLMYNSLFLSGFYYCLSMFWCANARMSELELEQGGREILGSKQLCWNTLPIHQI
jgi:hypothetical protein